MSSLQKRDTEIGLLPLYSERWKLKLWEGVVSTFYSEWWKRRLTLIQDSTLSWTTETRSHLSDTHTFDHKHVILAPECLSNWVLGSNEHHKIYYSVAFVFLIHFLSFSFFFLNLSSDYSFYLIQSDNQLHWVRWNPRWGIATHWCLVVDIKSYRRGLQTKTEISTVNCKQIQGLRGIEEWFSAKVNVLKWSLTL